MDDTAIKVTVSDGVGPNAIRFVRDVFRKKGLRIGPASLVMVSKDGEAPSQLTVGNGQAVTVQRFAAYWRNTEGVDPDVEAILRKVGRGVGWSDFFSCFGPDFNWRTFFFLCLIQVE